MLIKYDGKSMLKRILCMILLLILAIMPIMIPAAQAVLVEAATLKVVEIIATVIIGSGFVFRFVEDARAAAGQIWDWLQTNRADVATFFRTWAEKYTGLDKINAGIRVSGQVIDAIKDAVNALFGATDTGFIATTWDNATVLDIAEWTVSMHNQVNKVILDNAIKDIKINDDLISLRVLPQTFDNCSHFGVFLNGELKFEKVYANEVWVLSDLCFYFANVTLSNGGYISIKTYEFRNDKTIEDAFWTGGSDPAGFTDYTASLMQAKPFTLTIPAITSFTGDLVCPSDDYIVKAPDLPDVVTDADGKELVVYPELPLNPADHLADIPLNPEGQKVEVPFDVPVDLSTGKALDDVGNPDKPGEGEGEGGNTGIWDWLKDLLQKILDAINGLIGALLDGLKALLVSLFVPGEGFLTDAFNDMLSPLQNKLPIGAYTDLVSKLQNVGAKELQNVQVTLYGQTVTIIDWGYYKANKATFDDIIRGFVFVLLLAYNINNIYKLVRNNDVLGKRRDEKL